MSENKKFTIIFTGNENEVEQASDALTKFLAVYPPEFVTVDVVGSGSVCNTTQDTAKAA